MEDSVGGIAAPVSSARPLPEILHSLAAGTSKTPRSSHTLHSPELIKTILQRECARCERSGSEFCLVVIDPGPDLLAKLQLGHLLTTGVRQTDEVGLFDEQRLCAFLPYTEPVGAEQFMARFKRRARAKGWNPVSELFVYPSRDDDGENDDTENDTRRDRRRDETDWRIRARTTETVAAGNVAGVEKLLLRHSPVWKRSIDILGATIALIVLFPLLLAIALAIKLTSEGPVLFSQWRSGLGARPFKIFKFRTMVPDADRIKRVLMSRNEQDGPAFKMKHDPRVTRIGRFLRRTSLDELPQLWNILRGEMSLVGPRPLPLDETRACDTWQKRRLDVVPGLTCTWQISGRGTVSFADWARMDRRYIRRRSFRHDLKLLLLTIPAVFSRRGAM